MQPTDKGSWVSYKNGHGVKGTGMVWQRAPERQKAAVCHTPSASERRSWEQMNSPAYKKALYRERFRNPGRDFIRYSYSPLAGSGAPYTR